MVIGHWSLVIGHWSLVIGHWSLATPSPSSPSFPERSRQNVLSLSVGQF
ncbi:hypothetical protein [Coleofasciculus sp. C1-SOL-03]